MGVPALFRFLDRKYPKIIQPVQEDRTLPISSPNPNGFECHNLYLDMNGIIHPCCHPQTGPAPANEEEMHLAIFAYLDRIMHMIRPRKLLYLAVDGVAPRAKMNQQRSRRFRAAQEAAIKRQKLEDEQQLNEGGVEDDEASEELSTTSVFDSNVITPGTKFMANISKAIRYWAAARLSQPEWAELSIIISDSSVPGEGEHKIVDFIRRQRTTPDHDPNECHVIYGLDADLIMLSMATHEPRFKVLREDVFLEDKQKHQQPQQPSDTPVQTTPQNLAEKIASEKPFIFLDVIVLREYLDVEMRTSIADSQNLEPERSLDDWIMLCFLVGNDFLPHLPSLDIRENAIDTLINIYKRKMREIGGHLTRNGAIAFDRLSVVIGELAQAEDGILARRMEREQRWRESQALRDAAEELNSETPKKRKLDVSDEEEEIIDQIKLGQPGYRARYYEHKFGIVDMQSAEGREKVNHICDSYLEGLAWVLLYYYQGCPSWKWFYPYHYAPFAADIAERLKNYGGEGAFSLKKFELGQPFRPFDQLMSVFPAASNEHLPEAFRNLMTDAPSPISHFYPLDFKIDLNGKRYAWQGVALLPFIDETLLLKTLEPVYAELDQEAKDLNQRGQDELWIGASNSLFGFMQCLDDDEWQPIDPVLSRGISGLLRQLSASDTVSSTISTMDDLSFDSERFIASLFNVPSYQGIFRSQILPGYKPPTPVLTDADRSMVASGRRNYNRNNSSNGNTMYREQHEREYNREMRGYKDDRPSSGGSMFVQPNPPSYSPSYSSASSNRSSYSYERRENGPIEKRPRGNYSRFD